MTKTYSDLHEYQKNSVTELYERPFVLASLPTGAGKTVIGLTAFEELQRAGLVRQGIVIGTKRISISVWPQEPYEWDHIKNVTVTPVSGVAKRRCELLKQESDLYCVSFNNIKWLAKELLQRDKTDPIFDLLIIDESSFLKDPKGVWGKTLQRLRPSFKNVWMLTGSPRPNSLIDFYRPMSILTNGVLWGRRFDKWRRAYFYPTDYMQYNWEPHAFAEKQLMSDVAAHSFKVPLSVVPRPASDPIIHKFDLNAETRKLYKTMERDLFASVTNKNGDNLNIVALNSAVSSGKLAQIVQGFMYGEDETIDIHNDKINILNELLLSNEGLATVIVYWFNEDLKKIKEAHPDIKCIGSDTSEEEGLQIECDWNAGKIDKLALHPASAGHGLNLQKVKAQLIHYCLIWSSELYAQTVARVARQGYAGGEKEWFVLNHLIAARDTIDEMKITRVDNKMTNERIALNYINSVNLQEAV